MLDRRPLLPLLSLIKVGLGKRYKFVPIPPFPDLLLPTATPFYKEAWFLAVVAVAGLIVLISVVVIVCICCVACCKWRRSRTYQGEEGRTSVCGCPLV